MRDAGQGEEGADGGVRAQGGEAMRYFCNFQNSILDCALVFYM